MFEDLVVGNGYSKKDLSEIFDNPNISIVREGIYNVSDSESFFFVDLEKKGKEDRRLLAHAAFIHCATHYLNCLRQDTFYQDL